MLEGLHKAFADACEVRGGIVLVRGEAGVGKTLVLRRFCDEVRAFARVLWDDCDALFTPPSRSSFARLGQSSFCRAGIRRHDPRVARPLLLAEHRGGTRRVRQRRRRWRSGGAAQLELRETPSPETGP